LVEAAKVLMIHFDDLRHTLATLLLMAGENVKVVSLPGKRKKPRDLRGFLVSGQGRDRTGDTRIFSPLLYQLSYLSFASTPASGGRSAVSDTNLLRR
jgi:hypothetical protein